MADPYEEGQMMDLGARGEPEEVIALLEASGYKISSEDREAILEADTKWEAEQVAKYLGYSAAEGDTEQVTTMNAQIYAAREGAGAELRQSIDAYVLDANNKGQHFRDDEIMEAYLQNDPVAAVKVLRDKLPESVRRDVGEDIAAAAVLNEQQLQDIEGLDIDGTI